LLNALIHRSAAWIFEGHRGMTHSCGSIVARRRFKRCRDEPGRRGQSVTMVAPTQPKSIPSNLVEATAAKKAFERRVNDAYITDALTPAEATVKEINPDVALAVGSAKVIPLKRKRSTDSDLLAGDQALDKLDQL